MTNIIDLYPVKNEPRVDSRVLAEQLGVQHKNALELIDKHKSGFEAFGVVAFQTRKPPKGSTGGRPETFALLNEDQAYLLLTFSRNTPRVVSLKVELVKAFGRFRREKQTEADYLPYYHELHDQVKALADLAHQGGSVTPERLFHTNINRMINDAFGLESGHRHELAGHLRAKVTAAHVLAKELLEESIANGHDHKAAYQHVKSGIVAFASCLGVKVAA
ncbi:Rha family transcriptional regulator [Methylovulum psychrotolerans]|uniref:Rha family transcriptional regulator n=1 Tax=Methylovulum psychrotolerans TaxID=1704499 RepID=UPI001BFF1704|nr:Rha family transcriptional regulator [Methylovulum psychrotolerans]